MEADVVREFLAGFRHQECQSSPENNFPYANEKYPLYYGRGFF
jgi:hypothetical protein